MTPETITHIALITNIAIAFAIGKYQQRNSGYSFSKTFFGALIGLTGLTLLAYKAFTS